MIFAIRKFSHSVKKDSLHSKQAEKIRIQRKRDSSVSVKFKNFGIQRKSADDPFCLKKSKIFGIQRNFGGYGSGVDVI